MEKSIPDEIVKVLVRVFADSHGATSELRICDYCRNGDREAVPYGVTDAQGRH